MWYFIQYDFLQLPTPTTDVGKESNQRAKSHTHTHPVPVPSPSYRPPAPRSPPTRLKGEVHDSVEGANEVFGGVDGQKCRCHWLLPLPARFPPGDAAAKIFGYCISSSSNGNSNRRGGRGSRSVRGAAVSETELAEYGGVVPNRQAHDTADGGGSSGGSSGEKGVLYAVPEDEVGLRRSVHQSLEERLAAMPAADSGSEGEFR